jgi:hypothetical protein
MFYFVTFGDRGWVDLLFIYFGDGLGSWDTKHVLTKQTMPNELEVIEIFF